MQQTVAVTGSSLLWLGSFQSLDSEPEVAGTVAALEAFGSKARWLHCKCLKLSMKENSFEAVFFLKRCERC